MFENTDDIVFSCRLDGLLRAANPAMCRFVGRPLPQILSLNLADITAPASQEELRRMLEFASDPEAPRRAELTLVGANG
ncbi:MAG: PAS domain-containing protein, partial [Bryobacteraceae bacterium]|nr:PAS domain-containing protein [Bryobacteraceae bacterium]